ncbi:MAG: signal peptidase II [Pseudomonadales bacterium]
MTPKLKTALGAFLIAVPADQITKTLVNLNLVYSDKVTVVEGLLYLTHVRNTGAAFGIFSDAAPTLRMVLFIGVSLLATAIILSFYRKLAPGDRLSALALGLILSGATGNLIDRIQLGEVIDFIHIRLWGGYSWPDFNLADSFIVVGVAILILELLATEGESRAQPDQGREHGAPNPKA